MNFGAETDKGPQSKVKRKDLPRGSVFTHLLVS